MKKFDGILLLSDLDGTLLNCDKSVSEENIKAIEFFKEQGGTFAFVTGRVPLAAVPIYELVKPNAPCGCMNGGGIYDYSKKELLWSINISRDVLKLVEFVDKNLPGVGIELCGFENIYFCKKSSSTEKHRKNENLEDISIHYSDVTEDIGKILFAEENEETLIKLMEMLSSHPMAKQFDFIRSDPEYYEILPKGINKGNIVKKLADILNVSENKIIAVGDNDNDESMLKCAKVGIAVSNATRRASCAADLKLDVSNEQHALAKIIDMLDKGEIAI